MVLLAFWLSNHLKLPSIQRLVLLAGSIIFYAWWNIYYLALLGGSILFNYVLGRAISNQVVNSQKPLWFGIAVNLLALGYFKYANFFVDQINHAFSVSIPNAEILLPLAISFFTFQQIAYLVDCYRGNAKTSGLMTYALFVSFFPQLIAGPIVRSREMIPQLDKFGESMHGFFHHLGPGITIFLIGLFKKVYLADSLAVYATPIFTAADQGATVTFFEAWIGALAYTFQLYFDFSGYSDMAIGLARMFGLRLPVNFYSPYKARSIISFWRCWHITLSRFLKEYLYIPLGGNRRGTANQARNILITMLLGGLWHGAGWTFVIWGGLHGIYILINHGWTRIRTTIFPGITESNKAYGLLAGAVTFIAIVSAWVIFRAHTIEGAMHLLSSMYGLNGLSFPVDYATMAPWLSSTFGWLGLTFEGNQIIWELSKVELFALLCLSAVITFALPNSAQIFALLEHRPDRSDKLAQPGLLSWSPNTAWISASIVLTLVSLDSMTQVSEFLYYQF